MTFDELNLSKSLLKAIEALGLEMPTHIQKEVFSVAMSGRDICAIAQTGTGKTFAYLLPSLRMFNFSKEPHPQVIILVPTRELVVQVVEQVRKLTQFMTVRTVGIYGGTTTKTQAERIMNGVDVLVATPGRLVDFLLNGTVKVKNIKKLIIDEFDEMLNLGFRTQLLVIFDKLPKKRQNLLFSATLMRETEEIMETFFNFPIMIEAVPAGTPLESIQQIRYEVPNFYTKVNLLKHLLENENLKKVLIFASTKKKAEFLFDTISEHYEDDIQLIHANKQQNKRFEALEAFESGAARILVATDLLARGLDIEEVTHVINFDLPEVAENYIHRIGRTGRYDKNGVAISFSTPLEIEILEKIESLMSYQVPLDEIPLEVEFVAKLLPEEMPKSTMPNKYQKISVSDGGAYHDKKDKNKKTNKRYNHEAEMKKKYGKQYKKK